MSTNLYANKNLDQAKHQFMEGIKHLNPHEVEFHQAVEEVVDSVMEYYLVHPKYRDAQILERLTEPDRIVSFRVPWEDDAGNLRANRAWRVQFNKALGPYKGGLRFDKSVNQSVLKFLGFEQVFKNAMTKLPLGGAKGGSNFNPKGKSEREIMRFCQSLMTELHRHIGPDVDVPAGDIGVGSKEVSFMFAQYLRLENRWHGVMTGKSSAHGGSLIRTEATGYGCVYFCQEMLKKQGESLEGKDVLISGSGNVAVYAAERCTQMGAKVLTLSDSGGTLYVRDGITPELLEEIKVHKFENRGRLAALAEKHSHLEFSADKKPWSLKADIAMPCATQNEVGGSDANQLVEGGIRFVCEGANMPVDKDGISILKDKRIFHAPGKAANAGGVAVSGLEMSQNSMRLFWSAEKVDKELATIISSIHDQCAEEGQQGDFTNYIDGANIASFKRVADVILSYGLY